MKTHAPHCPVASPEWECRYSNHDFDACNCEFFRAKVDHDLVPNTPEWHAEREVAATSTDGDYGGAFDGFQVTIDYSDPGL